MSDFLGLYTAFTGLQAAQAGLDTTSHNIANAGTTGFTRQRVDLASRLPAELAFGKVGTGVSIEDITRARRDLLDVGYRASVAGEAQFSTLAGLLGNAEAALGEPEHGITAAVGSLWGSFEALALDPPDQAARAGVITELHALTGRIRSVAGAWETAGTAALEDLQAGVAETNRLLGDVAALNRSILLAQSSPGQANDLLDQRDRLIDRLASLAGVTSSVTDTGTARISIGGLALVHDTAVSALSVDAGTGAVSHSSGAAVTAGGSIAGYQTFLGSELPAQQQALDALATEIADALNTQHAAGYTPTGAPGGPLLAYTPGAAALTLTVAISSGSEVAAAGNAGPPVAPFDGTNVEALAALRTALAGTGGTTTLDEAARGLVGALGSATSAALTAAASQSDLSAVADAARLEAHGVSIDEEMVNLLTYQRAYEAAARVMTAVDQMLDTLINRTGVVGR